MMKWGSKEPARKWRIYYDDGRTRDHTEGLPTGPKNIADRLGVQCVVQPRSSDGQYVTLHGAEFYAFLASGEWISVGYNGLEDYAVHCLEQLRCVTMGRAISKDILRRIYEQARRDADKALD